MKKLLLLPSLLAAMLFGVQAGRAATITLDGFTYSSSGTKLTVTKGPASGPVVIPDTIIYKGTTYTVQEIAKNAFKGSKVTSLTTPVTMKKILSSAFEGCTELTNITLNEGLTNLDPKCFKGCTKLQNFVMPNTVTQLGSYSFESCTSITKVVLSNALTMAIGSPFRYCTALKSVTVGAKMTSFTESGFCKDAPLEEILVAEGSTRLKSIDGVLYDNKVTDLKAYPTHRHAETFILPETVTKMSDKFQGIQYLKTFIGNDALTAVYLQSFQNCPLLETVQLGKKVSSFGYRCFTGCPNFQKVVFSADNSFLKFEDGCVLTKDGTVLYLRVSNTAAPEYTAPPTLATIGDYAFYGNVSLQKVTLPETVTSLGNGAFYQCSSLTSVNIPSLVKEILPSTFYYCRSLTSMVIPDSVKSIGSEAFYYCYNLNDVTIGASVDSIASMAFSSCAEDLSVYMFPAMPPKIDVQSSYYASFADSTVMYVKAESMQAYLNDSTYKAYKIRLYAPPTAQVINLEEPGTLSTKIPESQMNGVKKLTLTGVMNGNDFDFINRMALIDTLDLSGVKIVAGGTFDTERRTCMTSDNELPKHSIYKLSRLALLQMPSTLTAIADSALCTENPFCDNVLKNADIPASVTRIGQYAFYNREGLAELNLPANLKYIGNGAFLGCNGIRSVVLPAAIDTLRPYTFFNCRGLEQVTFPEGLKAFEDFSMGYCVKLTSITLPNSVDSIGNHVFSGCSALKNIKFSENLRILNRNAFQATAVEELNLPQSLTFIGSSAFSGCDKLTKVNIPENVTTIDDGAFCMDSLITQIFIPRYIYKLGNRAFERCRSIKVATVAYTYEVPGTGPLTPLDETRVPSRTRIGYEVFMNCTALEKIFFGPTVKSLGSNFFACTPNLKKIFLANPVPPDMYADEQAFDSYTATLYVPKASIETYRTNRYWGKFKNIKAIEGCTNDVDEFFTDTQPGDEIIVSDGAIDFANPDAEVTVFNLSGKVIYSGKAARLSVAPAVYIVSVNSRPVKVIVR